MSTEKAAYHHGNLREALVRTALALLEDGGVEALTLRAAARGAGVSAMAPYRHFADKAALLTAVAAQGYADLRDRLAHADGQTDARQALVEQGVAYVLFACERPALFRLMFGAPLAAPRMPPASADTAYGILAARVAGLVPAAEREAATMAAWSLVHGLACLTVDGRLPPPVEGNAPTTEALARRVTGLFAAGLAR